MYLLLLLLFMCLRFYPILEEAAVVTGVTRVLAVLPEVIVLKLIVRVGAVAVAELGAGTVVEDTRDAQTVVV